MQCERERGDSTWHSRDNDVAQRVLVYCDDACPPCSP